MDTHRLAPLFLALILTVGSSSTIAHSAGPAEWPAEDFPALAGRSPLPEQTWPCWWEQRAHLPFTTADGGVTAWGGRLFVTAGYTADGRVGVYSPATDSWKTGAVEPLPYSDFASAAPPKVGWSSSSFRPPWR